MVKLEKVLPAEEQSREEEALAASGKGRSRHADAADDVLLRSLVERHLKFTGSTLALSLLDDWERARAHFVKVFPTEYARALGEMHAARNAAAKPAARARAAA